VVIIISEEFISKKSLVTIVSMMIVILIGFLQPVYPYYLVISLSLAMIIFLVIISFDEHPSWCFRKEFSIKIKDEMEVLPAPKDFFGNVLVTKAEFLRRVTKEPVYVYDYWYRCQRHFFRRYIAIVDGQEIYYIAAYYTSIFFNVVRQGNELHYTLKDLKAFACYYVSIVLLLVAIIVFMIAYIGIFI